MLSPQWMLWLPSWPYTTTVSTLSSPSKKFWTAPRTVWSTDVTVGSWRGRWPTSCTQGSTLNIPTHILLEECPKVQSLSVGNSPKKCQSFPLGISSPFPGETASRYGGGSRSIQYQSVLLDINSLSIVQVFLTDANKMTSWTMQFLLLGIKKIKDGK